LLIALILVFSTAVIVPVHAQSPLAGVCLGPDGTPSSSCPAYMEVVSVDMAVSSGSYVGTINVAGTIPSSLGDPNRFLEWDFLIDADRNNLTNPWAPWSLVENDIGADYRLFLGLQGTRLSAAIQDLAHNTYANVKYSVSKYSANGTAIQLTFTPSSIYLSTNGDFDFVVAVREYAKAGDPTSFMMFDKAPNVGHYSFVGGALTVVPEFPVSAPILFTITLAAVLFFTRKRTKTLKIIKT
jgi:hypothetical protein